MCQKYDARDASFPSSRARFFRIHRGPTSRREAASGRTRDRMTMRPDSTPHAPHIPTSPQPRPILTLPSPTLALSSPRPRPDLAPTSPRPRPDLAPEISHVIRFLDNSTTATNVAIPTTGFQCLKDARGNYVRDCWETTTQRPPPTQRGRDRRTRPRPRRGSGTNQTRKGSFLTSPRPFHHAPRPSVSPALVSGIRMRTSA